MVRANIIFILNYLDSNYKRRDRDFDSYSNEKVETIENLNESFDFDDEDVKYRHNTQENKMVNLADMREDIANMEHDNENNDGNNSVIEH